MNYNWNWGILLSPEPGGTGTYLHYLIVGLGWTLATALAAWVIALAIGSVVGTLRTTPHKWVVRLGNAYVEIFRNIPLIVQMFLWFFVVPELLPKAVGDFVKQMPPRPAPAVAGQFSPAPAPGASGGSVSPTQPAPRPRPLRHPPPRRLPLKAPRPGPTYRLLS